jgi:hypothetical protein
MKIFENRPRRPGLSFGPSGPTSVLSETLPIMLDTITTVKTLNIPLQAKYTCIINKNIREPPEETGVDIRTLEADLGPLTNTSHNV